MALFFFLLFVSGPLCVFFFKAYPGSGASNSSFLLVTRMEQLDLNLLSRAGPYK